jgi:hypothetical protein
MNLSIGADVMIVDPIAASYSMLDEAKLFSKYETLKREKHVSTGATMVQRVMTCFRKLGAVTPGALNAEQRGLVSEHTGRNAPSLPCFVLQNSQALLFYFAFSYHC